MDLLRKIDKNSLRRTVCTIAGIAVNVLLGYLTNRLHLPFYLDTAGTIFVSAVGGAFPGVLVAVATNVICSLFSPYAPYYMVISVAIAMCTAWFVKANKFRNRRSFVLYILIISVSSGILSMIFQWILLGGPQFADVAEISGILAGGSNGFLYFFCAMMVSIGLNIVDKGLMACAALAVFRFVPDDFIASVRHSVWKQKPLTEDEKKDIRSVDAKESGIPLRVRMPMMLVFATLAIAIIMGFIGIHLYYEDTKEEYKQDAISAARFAASIVDGEHIDDYVREGEAYPGYKETEDLLEKIRDSASGVLYLYVIRVEQDGCRFVFDLDTDDTPGYEPGEMVEFEEAFESELPMLFAGEEIEPIESNDTFGWVLTAYYPIRDKNGKTVAYAGADVSMVYLSRYFKDYIIRVLLIFSGFFVWVLGYGLWYSGYFLIYPIGSLAVAVREFIHKSDEQEDLDEHVRTLKELNIHTGDEVEGLYESICRMSSETAEQMRSIRHYAEATAQMQNGLIVTMADMVESRDSDTGAHVQKTAAYVRIILNGLKAKGYYVDKLTSKYMSDVEMSAPLHDVGKINIPDAILNKPGKLTEKEFEIMKTHTTAGKKILEKAINTVQGESYLKEARNMAAYHHERWDGKGYPEGLYGEVIPLSARVMAVADVFDALSSPRVYKPAFPLDKALQIIEEGAGTQFDPKCVEVFMEALPEVKYILKKYNGDQ